MVKKKIKGNHLVWFKKKNYIKKKDNIITNNLISILKN